MLKPSELGLDGKYRTIVDHKKTLVDKISKLKNKKLARVLMAIMESKSGDTVDVDDINQSQINEIKNYYAESVAPVLLFPDPTAARLVKCYFSSSQTEGLYDFKIEWEKKEYLFSNKQLKGGTNTLKAGDVVKLVEADDILKNKWGNTKQFKVFKILDESNVISGPIKAVKDCYPTAVPTVSTADMTKVINQMTKNDVIIEGTPKSIMNLIKKDKAAYDHYNNKGVVSGTMVNYIFEKILIEISKDDSFNELFLDVTNGNVYFFKFDLNSNNGKVTYELSDPKQSKKKAILRSKQGVERRSSSGALKLDKLGFQP